MMYAKSTSEKKEGEEMKCPMNETCICGEPHYQITDKGKEMLEILGLNDDDDEVLRRLKGMYKK